MQPYQHDAATIDVIQNTAAIEDDRTDSIENILTKVKMKLSGRLDVCQSPIPSPTAHE